MHPDDYTVLAPPIPLFDFDWARAEEGELEEGRASAGVRLAATLSSPPAPASCPRPAARRPGLSTAGTSRQVPSGAVYL